MAKISIATVCPFCGSVSSVSVEKGDYLNWQAGMMAQDAFPYLSSEEREMLISGICPTCWDNTFGSDEEEEEEEDFYEEDDYFPECYYDPYAGCYLYE